MSRCLKRITGWILSLALCLELLPLSVFAATDTALRFRMGFTGESVVIYAIHQDAAYVLGGTAGGRGVAVAANGWFINDAGDRYLDISQSKAPLLLRTETRERARWEYEHAFVSGDAALRTSGGALSLEEPADAARYWETGFFDNDEWVSALCFTENEATSYLALYVGDGGPYFTVTDALSETYLPCGVARQEPCSHPSLTRHDGSDASCTEPGMAAYWTCAACEAAERCYRFLDDRGTVCLWDNPVPTTPALGHIDGNADDVCDRCGAAMPVFTRVTTPSEIQSGMTYLLAAEIDGALRLLAPLAEDDGKGGKAPSSRWVMPATAAVETDGEGAIPYRAAQDALALMFRLAQAGGKNQEQGGGKGKGGELEGADYLYSILCPDETMLECDGGRGFFAEPYGGYGWRVRQNGEAAEIIPRMMEDDPIGYSLRAVEYEGNVWFAACPPSVTEYTVDFETWEYIAIGTRDVYATDLGIEGEAAEYPVCLYIMSGQDVESWDYEVVQGETATDFSAVAERDGFSAATAARASVTGLAEAVTDRMAREKIEDYRDKTGSRAAHYTVTAYSTLTAASFDPADAETGETLCYTMSHHLSVSDGQHEPISYALTADVLQDAQYALTLYSWHDPAQIWVTGSFLMGGENELRESSASFRKADDPLFGEGKLTTFSFAREEGLNTLVCTDLPVAARLNGAAVIEPHEHEFNWDYPDYLQKQVIREDGHYLRCERCDEPIWYREHNYQHVSCSFELTDDGLGEYVYQCLGEGCLNSPYYEKRAPIDPAEWAWVSVVDQYGDPVPQTFGVGGDDQDHYIGGAANFTVSWYKGELGIRGPERNDPDYIAGGAALHYDENKIYGYGDDLIDYRDKPLRCVVTFTEGGRLRYKAPTRMEFNDVQLGQPIHIEVQKRSGRMMTVTGRLPAYMDGWRATQSYLTVMLPEINYFYPVTIRDDLSFTVTAPYAHSELHFTLNSGNQLNWESRSLVIRSVEDLGEFDENTRRIDLGELDFENHDCCDSFRITVADPVAANAARAAYRGGTFQLTNNTTGETWTKFRKSLPDTYMVTEGGSPYDTTGPFTFTLTMQDGYSDYFAVGDELTLTCELWDDAFGMDPYTFTLDNRTGGGTQSISPTFYRRGMIFVDTSYVEVTTYHGWWSLIFDSEGTLLTNCAVGGVPLDPGVYTYLAYQKNEYVDMVDNPDAMELLQIPTSCYYKQEVIVTRGENVTVQPVVNEFTAFDPYKNVVVSATVGDNLRTGEAVPIYITYKGFDTDYAAALGDYTMTLDIVGKVNGGYQVTLPLVMVDGQYAFWDQGEQLEYSPMDIALGGFHYAGLTITTRAPEGTICLYAVPEGETLYITAKSSVDKFSHESSCYFSLAVPSNRVSVQAPPSFTSEPDGKLVYFANLPKNEHGYVAKMYRDGVECDWDYVSMVGLGQNSLDYSLGLFGTGTWFHVLEMEILAVTEVDENGGWTNEGLESVWHSPAYPIALNQSEAVPQPNKLLLSVTMGGKPRGSSTIDLKGSGRRQANMTCYPVDFDENGRLNQELIYQYSLIMDHPEPLIEGERSVFMAAYCGEAYIEPFVEQVTLTYNEHTQTFDGTLTLEAGTIRLNDLPYGYTFYYDYPEPSPDSVNATKQTVEQLKSRIHEMQSMEAPLPIPELVDLGELEDILVKDDEMEPWEKDVIRLCASYQNSIHVALTEFQSEFADIYGAAEDMDWATLLATGVLEENDPNAEILSLSVTEDALLERGYQKAETELGDYYVFSDAGGTGAVSVIFWSEDPAQRLHRWSGVSPLPAGTPVKPSGDETPEDDDALSAESTLLLSDRDAVNAAKNSLDAYYQDNFIPTLINVLSVESAALERIVALAGRLIDVELLTVSADVGTRVKHLNGTVDTINNRIAENHVSINQLERDLADTQKRFYDKYSKFGVKAPTETIHVSQAEGEVAEFIKLGNEIKDTRAKLENLEASVKSDVSELRRVENSGKLWEKVDSICKTARKAKLSVERFAKTASPHVANAMGVLCMVLDMYSYSQALKEANRSAVSEEKNREVMNSIRANMAEQAGQPCIDRNEASKQCEKCDSAYYDYCERSYKYVESTMVRANTKYTMVCADLIAVMAAFAAAPAAPVIALGVIGANGISDGACAALMAWRWSRLQRAEKELTKQCIKPLPFKQVRKCETPRPQGGGSGAPDDPPRYPVPPAPVMDPSGYAYEAVASNRLVGVTATVWFRDAYGEETPWLDAPYYDEIYEQITGADGRYEWMTPPGRWKVKVSKDGYLDADSSNDPEADEDGWLPVPPPQMNVNIAMTALAAPAVKSASAAPDRVRVVFTQYMTADSAAAARVTQDGQEVAVNAAFTDLEESPAAEGVFYGRVLELTRTDGGAFSGSVAVSVSAEAESYAGKPLEAFDSGALTVEPMVGSLSHVYPNRFVTDFDDTEELVVTARDTEGAALSGVPVTVTQENGGTLQFARTTVTSDSDGRAVFTATGVSSGYDVLTFAADTVTTRMNTRVKPPETESPKKPAASLTDGQTVEEGTTLTLSCETEGAVIYYTTDDTCPCQESESRMQYTGPIPVTETTLFRVASYTELGGYSERLNLRLYVTKRPKAARTANGLAVTDCDAADVLIAGFYDADGALTRAERVAVTEGSAAVTWTDAPFDVRLFFLDPQWRPVCPAWTEFRAD